MGEGRIARRVRVLAFVACAASAASDVHAQPPAEVPQPSANGSAGGPRTPPSREADIASRVLGDLEDVWGALFQAMGAGRRPPAVLVLYTWGTRSACGMLVESPAPRYCPVDRRIYFEPDAWTAQAQPRSDVAIAYAMARAYGEHVQNLLGTTHRPTQSGAQDEGAAASAMTIRAGLQAECYGGVWFFYATKRHHLEEGELDEAAKLAANAAARASVSSSREPLGSGRATAEQRERWFRKGAASGDPRLCDTFTASSL